MSRVLPVTEFQTGGTPSSSQTVMPEAVRTTSELRPGVEFAGGGEADRIALGPSKGDFDDVMKRARQGARRAGMRRSDVASAIAVVRSS